MNWKKITMENFLSIEKAELVIENRGLVLIEGVNKTNAAFKSNGAGKTTILNSIVYALYGMTANKVTADAVINRQAGKGTAVILEGEREGVTYRIERYRKHKKNSNKVLLFRDGKEITGKSAKDTNALIEGIIGIDFNTFCNSILFSQGSGAGRFSKATDKEKKEILESLQNLSIYGKAQEIAKDRVKEKQQEITEQERNVERLSWELENIINLEKADLENYSNTREALQKHAGDMKELVEQLANYSREVSPVRKSIEEDMERQKKAIDGFASPQTTNHNQELNQANQTLFTIKNEQSTDISEKERLLQQYKQLESDTHCPVCGNEVDNTHRLAEQENIKAKLREILVRIQGRLGVIEQAEAQVAEQQRLQDVVVAEQNQQSSKYRSMVEELNENTQRLHDIERNMQGHRDRVSNLQERINMLGEVEEPKPRTKEKAENEKKKLELKKLISTLTTEKANLEDVVKVYGNTGVKSHVLDLITPYLNKQANKYLRVLSGSDIAIEFSTQSQNKDGSVTDRFEVQVFNGSGGDTYESNSEGEKKRIDLAISLAIQDFVMSKPNMVTNFVLYDEVFDALDNVGCENTIELLEERLDKIGTIFVITHKDELKSLFSQSITAEKVNGITKIKEGVTSSEN